MPAVPTTPTDPFVEWLHRHVAESCALLADLKRWLERIEDLAAAPHPAGQPCPLCGRAGMDAGHRSRN